MTLTRLLAAGLLLALGLAAPARAQEQSETRLINTPAESFAMTPGGVDIRTGRYAYEQTDLSIGGEGSQGLALSRTLVADVPGHGNPFDILSHNWDIMVSERRVLYDDPNQNGIDYRIFVHFGGRSQTFKSRNLPNYVGFGQESNGPRARLTYTGERGSESVAYTYQAPDGTVAEFRPLGHLGYGDCSTQRRCAFVSQITEPDGTRYTFDYAPNDSGLGGTQRLRRVTSSRGYALVLEGNASRVTRACVFNLALGAAGEDCSSNPLATASYSYASSEYAHTTAGYPVQTYRLTGATGPDGATEGFSYENGVAAPPVTIGFTRPGDSQPWLTNYSVRDYDEQGVLQNIVTAQRFADGGSYDYVYGRAPTTNQYLHATIAGGAYVNALGESVSMPYDWPLLHATTGNSEYYCNQPPCQLPAVDGFMDWVRQQTPGPVRIVDPLGRTTILNYCDPYPMANLPAHEMNRCVVVPLVSFTDPEGAKTELQHDGHGNITRVTRHPRPGSTLAPIVTRAEYETGNPRTQTQPRWMEDARGNRTDYTYDPAHGGLLTQTGPAPSPGAPRPQTRHVYAQRKARGADGSELGPSIWVRTETSLCRTSAATGSPCATADDEVLTTYDYGPDSGPNNLLLRGQAVISTDGGIETTLRTCYAYDALGRRISETRPAGTAGLSSCPGAAPTMALPHTTSTRYDADGRVTGTISADPDGAGAKPHLAMRNSYDPAGRLIKIETGTLAAWQSDAVAPADWTGFSVLRSLETQYDMMSRKVRLWTREGASGTVRTMTEYSYDLAGRQTCTAVRMNPVLLSFAATPVPNACIQSQPNLVIPDRVTRIVYDAAGQRLQLREGVQTLDEAAEATWAYNQAGQITTVIDGNGNRAALLYDGHGRQSCWMFPSTTRAANYNDATQATALASAGALGGTITDGQCASGDYEAYGYDPNGNRVSLRKRDGQAIGYDYDALNRMTAKNVPGPGTVGDVAYAYDLRGLQTYAVFPATGEGIANSHDGFGRLASTTSTMGLVARTLSYRYDANGNRIRITHPDGIFFTTAYDGLNRPEWMYDATGYPLIRYVHDAHGRLVARSQGNGGGNDFAWDALGRLSIMTQVMAGTSADAWVTFGYNPAGQIASIGRDNDAYAFTRVHPGARPYETNGLNQYRALGEPGARATFRYDPNGNLDLETPPAPTPSTAYVYDSENRLVSASGASNATLRYDPLGRLYEIAVPSGAATRFLYDGDALVAEYNAAGALTHRYVHGPNTAADDPLIDYVGSSLTSPYYLHADHQGSIVAISGAGAAMQTINAYDEYGMPNVGNVGRFQYTGQVWLAELGLYYYKARLYSPALGRFLQVDPIGYDDQFNLYTYVGNDPVNMVDPTGLCETQTGSRICRSLDGSQTGRTYGTDDGTRMIRSQRISQTDENGNSNVASLTETVAGFEQQARQRTADSGYTREHGVTAALDPESNQWVVSLFQGPTGDRYLQMAIGEGQQLAYASHTHRGLGVYPGSMLNPLRELHASRSGRTTVERGPSTRPNGDLDFAKRVLAHHPHARLGVWYQVHEFSAPPSWQYAPFGR